MRHETLAILALSLVVAAVDAKADHFPFTEGVIHEFERVPEPLGRFIVYFSGTAEIESTTTHVRRTDSGQQEFWSETSEGDKYLHGAAFGLEEPLLFSPPILAIDEPLSVGKTWEMDIRDTDGIEFHIRYEVIAFGDVTVPAGTFHAFTLRRALSFPELKPDQDIRRLVMAIGGTIEGSQQVSHRSYVNGLGQILWTLGSRTDQLLSIRTVGVESTTWTRIRMLFGDVQHRGRHATTTSSPHTHATVR